MSLVTVGPALDEGTEARIREVLEANFPHAFVRLVGTVGAWAVEALGPAVGRGGGAVLHNPDITGEVRALLLLAGVAVL